MEQFFGCEWPCDGVFFIVLSCVVRVRTLRSAMCLVVVVCGGEWGRCGGPEGLVYSCHFLVLVFFVHFLFFLFVSFEFSFTNAASLSHVSYHAYFGCPSSRFHIRGTTLAVEIIRNAWEVLAGNYLRCASLVFQGAWSLSVRSCTVVCVKTLRARSNFHSHCVCLPSSMLVNIVILAFPAFGSSFRS